jgi:hypothetical protein
MTVNEAITHVNNLEPNQYSDEDKLGWLNQLDGQIFDELILTHEHEEGAEFSPHTETTEDLLVPAPYDREVYTNYLKAMIADANHETLKYNGSMTLFNSAYARYAAKINREKMPLPPFRENRLHF